MQAVVKTPHIEISIKGHIPDWLLSLLKEEYGEIVTFIEELDKEKVNIFETEWYKKQKPKLHPLLI